MADKKEEQIIDITQTYSRFEHWLNKNKMWLSYLVGGITIVILGYVGFTKFYLGPKETDAQNEMWKAQDYFASDSLNLALNGDKTHPGFLKIIDDYKWTKAANLAQVYCGMIYMKQGKFDEAIEHLEKFNGKDVLVSGEAFCLLGDAYSEKGENDKAIENYKKAAYNHENELTSAMYLKKAGMLSEKTGKNADAVKFYQEIKEKYPTSAEARDIDKFIARAQG